MPGLIDLVVAAGLFAPGDAAFLAELVPTTGDATCVVQETGDGLEAVVLYRPEDVADRVFDLTLIAVRPDVQGSGRGTALMRYVEEDLRHRRQRLLVVRTSGLGQYDRTRAFYRRLGYSEQTRVSDYWADGDDLVLFTRRL